MTKPFIVIATLMLALFSSQRALALCGDVTGDNTRTASDALAVLRSAVGQQVDLICEDSGPSKMRYTNDFTCQSGSSVSQAKFNGLTFEADGGATSDYQVVDRTSIDHIEIDLCGGVYNFDGPLNLPPNRALTFFLVLADPAVYGTDNGTPAFFVILDDGTPASALTAGAAPTPAGGNEIGVMFGWGTSAE